MCDSVGNIGKLFGRIIVEIAENALLDDIAVQSGNAVYFMGTVNGKIGHFDCIVGNNRHPGNFVPVAREAVPKVFAEPTIDFFENGINSGQ